MQVFQYFFNPKLSEDLILDCTCFYPENIYEKKLGSLYMVGVLKNALPQNQNFLKKIENFIKENYYNKFSIRPERAIKETLKETNEFLANLTKKGDVSWLGNLSFAVLNLKEFNLNFTKTGEIRIFLKRGKKIIDIDKKMRLLDIEPYPLKIFGNVVSGKLVEGDLILILTSEIFDFFQKENLIQKIKEISAFDEKEFKKMFDEKKEKMSKIKGILFALLLSKETTREKKEIISPTVTKEFSLKNVFQYLLLPLTTSRKERKEFSFSELLSPMKENFLLLIQNKKFLLILALILILVLGYFLF